MDGDMLLIDGKIIETTNAIRILRINNFNYLTSSVVAAGRVLLPGSFFSSKLIISRDKSIMIQASINFHDLNTFKSILEEESFMSLGVTDVNRNNQSLGFACSFHWPYKLTSVNREQELNTGGDILVPLLQSVDVVGYYTNNDLPGKVMGISTTYNKETQTTQCVMANISIHRPDLFIPFMLLYSQK
ncbi:hypothetical protein Bca101_023986 [Brassica carinata]